MERPIYVTQPALPPLDEFIPYLQKIWDTRVLTNNGQFHKQLEEELREYLGVKYISLFCNGTIALITALQFLKITGEVITTPFSFVATANSLVWNGLKPVFADIEEESFTIDPDKIEELITPETTAILAVHVYGNPCNMDAIKKIADKFGLKVIYDAAHAFGIKTGNSSVLNCGDLSMLSFHATKTFTTFEGGAIVCNDEQTKKTIDNLKNFGFAGETSVIASGINGKMNEIQAAFGLMYLKHVDTYIRKTQKIAEAYRQRLGDIQGLRLCTDRPDITNNYAYFPILIDEGQYGMSRNALYEKLKKNNIYCRRYFYPLISQFKPYTGFESAKPGKLPVAEKITEQVLCLPIYPELRIETVEMICSLVARQEGDK